MRTILVVVALVWAIIAALLGFEIVTTDSNVLGWIAASLACYFGSLLVGD